MTVDVFPISLPTIDWPKLLSTGQNYLGRSLASSLDQSGMKPGSLSSYVSILESISGRDVPPQKSVGLALSSLRQIVFGFLILGEKEVISDFMLFGCNLLTFTLAKERNFLIASGNLESWKWLLMNTKRYECGMQVASIFTLIRAYFDQAGLKNLYSEKLL